MSLSFTPEPWFTRKTADVLIYIDDQYTIVFSEEIRGGVMKDGNDTTIVDASNSTAY